MQLFTYRATGTTSRKREGRQSYIFIGVKIQMLVMIVTAKRMLNTIVTL